MIRKILLVLLVLSPMLAYARSQQNVQSYLLGKWQVEGVRSSKDKKFHPPRHKMKWQFKQKGILIEELGSNGAKIIWHYRVIGRDIQVKAAPLSFSWQILGMEKKVMLLRHQMGLLKVRRM